MYLRLEFVQTDGTDGSHGSPTADASSRRGCSQRSPAGAGIPAGVARSFGGVLSEHYGSPGRLAEHKRQFERASRDAGLTGICNSAFTTSAG